MINKKYCSLGETSPIKVIKDDEIMERGCHIPELSQTKYIFSKMMPQCIFGYWLVLFNIKVSWAKTTEEQVLIP